MVPRVINTMNTFRRYLADFVIYLLIGVVIHAVSTWLQSDFIETFLDENLITLLLALLAINTTTISVIMTKLREISDQAGISFDRTIHSMKSSVVEQVVLLAFAVVVSVLKSSNVINSAFTNANFIANVLLISILLRAVYILYDTANGVFVIAQKEEEIDRN